MHRHLSKSIYRWKINDAYHGGVPDTFYSGRNGHCFIEYKYKEKLPKRDSSQIILNLSPQQRIWLTLQHSNNVICYAVLASKDKVFVTQEFNMPGLTLKDFNEQSIPFKEYIQLIENITIKQNGIITKIIRKNGQVVSKIVTDSNNVLINEQMNK